MRWLVYLGILVLGILLFSQAIAMIGLEPVPGDLSFQWGSSQIHIPVLYSLAAVAIMGLLFYFFRR